MRVTIAKHTISLGLIGAILSILCLGAVAAYMLTVSIPVTVQEPIEILNHPEALSLYPGETIDFNITIQNHASVDYALFLEFYLDNIAYQQSYVTTSNETYSVHTGVQNLSSWLKVSTNAPSLSSALAVSFRREAHAPTQTEQMSITNLSFQTGTPGSILIIANNTGTSVIIINEVWVNNAKQTTSNPALPSNINANAGLALNVTLNIAAGYSYQVKLVSSKGNQFLYTGTAPT